MGSTAGRLSNYVLGHSESELARLTRQGQVFLPFTRQLLEQAGIGAGMRVLDVGSGAGDVSFLVGELVGPKGIVIGVDLSEAAVQWATARARSSAVANVRFLIGDPAEMEFRQPFDAVVGRFVLMFYHDPADALRRLSRSLRPAGLMVFQEYDLDYICSRPTAPTFDRATELMKRTFRATGARTRLGVDLHQMFLSAGLPDPRLRFDILIAGGQRFQAFELLTGTVQSLLPAMEKLGIATAAELDLPTLTDRMRDEVITGKGVVLSPALIGAWCTKACTR